VLPLDSDPNNDTETGADDDSFPESDSRGEVIHFYFVAQLQSQQR
jgi:hypothetical protein